MRVNGISLHSFRNYGDETTDFSGGVNIICGENAAGKTNILEATMEILSTILKEKKA